MRAQQQLGSVPAVRVSGSPTDADNGVYFHRQHALYSEPDRAWTFTAHDHCAVGRARTPACYCHSAALGDVVKRLREPPSTRKPPLELLNVPRAPATPGA